MSYLLDTNVVSELRRRSPDPAVLSWLESVAADQLYLSVLTVGEISQGIARLQRRDPSQAAQLQHWLSELRSFYHDRIVPITAEVADRWGRLGAPDPVPVVDGLLAATAMVHGWTLVTRNVADVRKIDVAVLNPFEPAG
ncbi:hypothetical protein DFQ14_10837 [Halopolyspora algeriensis]|uniref:Ribonuclease VapC n=1 Tax=Halopolyspora algeriensis TaxID=1500506 RepID=A0A368VM46_9ACTN|nr:type II toxin-antitoxin system VapC family toxin [Halopolyspora algeriensis]RCW42781.1 hypothetical protein DFQ14_10837 [Halopolyspora algeriensis]TQM56749.1 hypothetical protein FHU43_1563 [Halopolyspora algeriensis]